MSDIWQPWPDLAALMKRAQEEHLWFWTRYQDLWFSPSELRNHWDRGQFRWGAVNWELRDPAERLMELDEKQNTIQQERAQVIQRILQ